jgi:hypothetical protein
MMQQNDDEIMQDRTLDELQNDQLVLDKYAKTLLNKMNDEIKQARLIYATLRKKIDTDKAANATRILNIQLKNMTRVDKNSENMSASTTNPSMNATLAEYLNVNQYNHVCRYWICVKNLTEKIDAFDYSSMCRNYDDKYDDETNIENNIAYNINLRKIQEERIGRIKYLDDEYVLYLNKIGFSLNDTSYNEVLFNFLNNGIII